MDGKRISKGLRVRATVVAAVAALASLGLGAASALATTGPTTIKRPPRYLIARSIIDTYLGRYRTGHQAPKSRVIVSDLLVTRDARGYAEGGIAIFAYDARGSEQQVLLALYDFHEVAGDVVASMVGPTGSPVYGHITFHHVGRSRSVTVLIRPTTYVGPGQVVFRYLGPPSGTAATKGRLVAHSQGVAWHAGWGAPAGFVGRYHLLPKRSPTGVGRVTGGELTLFLRQVKKGKPLVPSGILHLQSRTASIVVYLTRLKEAGAQRMALVNGGAFVGPVIGTLRGTGTRPGLLGATVQAQGIPALTARFTRFSSSPQP